MTIKVSDQESWDAVVKIALLSNNAFDLGLIMAGCGEMGVKFTVGKETFNLIAEGTDIKQNVKNLSSGEFVSFRQFGFKGLLDESPRKFKIGESVTHRKRRGLIVEVTPIGEPLYKIDFFGWNTTLFTDSKWIREDEISYETGN